MTCRHLDRCLGHTQPANTVENNVSLHFKIGFVINSSKIASHIISLKAAQSGGNQSFPLLVTLLADGDPWLGDFYSNARQRWMANKSDFSLRSAPF